MADRSSRIVAIATLALVAPVFVSTRSLAGESNPGSGVAPVVGFAIFDFGRTDKLRAKLAQSERREAAAESRANIAEEAARREHAAYEAEHAARERERAAYQREHVAYQRDLATLAAYRKQSDEKRDRLAHPHAANARQPWPGKIAGKRTAHTLVAAAPSPPKHPSSVSPPRAKQVVATPRPAANKSRHSDSTPNRSVGWGAI